ncbi:MAG: cyclic nucleotide-binding domain-containing protein [Trueperaceae bacterium]|nr:cyclic nucleotide-binding domain-containing protein [Trueperaceae bacterium]
MAGESDPTLHALPLFAGVPSQAVTALLSTATRRQLAAGETLFREGDPADGMYLLNQGRLDVFLTRDDRRVPVDQLEAPDHVGETALSAGRPRPVTVVAREPCILYQLTGADVAAWIAHQPEVRDRLDREVERRLGRARLAVILGDAFGANDPASVRELAVRLQWTLLRRGDTLFAEGDPADHAYVLASGRLRLDRADDTPTAVGEIAPGDVLGEASMLTRTPRTASCVALRDSRLVRLSREEVEAHPALMAFVARRVARRSLRRTRRWIRRPRTIALVPAEPSLPLAEVGAGLCDALAPHGEVRMVERRRLARVFGRADVADRLEDLALLDWLEREEGACEHLVFLADPHASPWTERCLRQADRVAVVARGDATGPPTAIERHLATRLAGVPADLVLLHANEAMVQPGTAAWLAPRHVRAHHHLRTSQPEDYGRVARHLSDRARILVLSGGGARGYVHIGLIAALEGRRLRADAVVGTSMGAIVGGNYALSGTYVYTERSARTFGDRKRLIDTTLPLVALSRSKGLTDACHGMYGDAHLEDMVLPFACVSSSVGRAEAVVHQHGPLWRAVRASTAIPGIFTPILEDGDVLVDGGVMNAFPVDLARQRFGQGPLIASNAYGAHGTEEAYRFGDHVSGWSALAQKLLPRQRRAVHAPSMMKILMRASTLLSHARLASLGAEADLLVRYPTDDVGSLDFDRVDELIALGRTHGEETLAAYDPWGVGTPLRPPRPTPDPTRDERPY